jgi:hypothetical protein
MRLAATVVARVGDSAILDVGGQRLTAKGPWAVGDTPVVDITPGGPVATQTQGAIGLLAGLGAVALPPGQKLPARVRVDISAFTATDPEPDFGGGHRVVPTLLTLEIQRSRNADA